MGAEAFQATGFCGGLKKLRVSGGKPPASFAHNSFATFSEY
jgi:hypothetical protein